MALAFHAREHGFSASPVFVLAQGRARVDIRPWRARLEALTPQAERYFGQVVRCLVWDRLLREYYFERVFVDITVERLVVWPDLSAACEMEVTGAPWPGATAPQLPPENGTGPRVDSGRAAGRIATLPHRVLGIRGADGFPVVVPVQVAGHDAAGLRLVVPGGLLPPGGRRAGLLAHAYRPQLAGLSTRIFTGWLDVDQRRHRHLRTPHIQRVRGAAPQEAAAGVERTVREIRDVAGTPPRNRRAAGTTGRGPRSPLKPHPRCLAWWREVRTAASRSVVDLGPG